MSHAVGPEVESKLAVPDAETLSVIARLRQLGPYRLRQRPRQRLHTLYLDTPDLALARDGVALRLRRNGKHWEASVKWAGRVKGDIHERPELTIPLDGEPAMPFVLSNETLRMYLTALVLGRPLKPVLQTDNDRRLLDLLPTDPQNTTRLAEVALDQFDIRRPGEQEPLASFCEVEIERLNGSVSDVQLATEILKQDLHLGTSTSTKFGRGMNLLFPELRRRGETALRKGDDAQQALRRIVTLQLRRLRACEPGARLGEDSEAVHDMRVAVRRLRAAVQTCTSALSSSQVERLERELEWLGDELGKVRDLDVQLLRIAEFSERAPAGMRDSLTAMAKRVAHDRDERRETMLKALDSRRHDRLLLSLEAVAQRGGRAGKGVPAAQVGAEAVRRAHKKLRKAAGATDKPSSEGMHELRIRAKRLRYVLEFFAPLAGKAARRAVRDLANFQDVLGRYHDAIVATDAIRTYSESLGEQARPGELLTLGALIGTELQVAEDMRARFAKSWKRFDRGKRRDHMNRVMARLEEQTDEAKAKAEEDSAASEEI